jgi:hypothetical protein
VNSAVGDGGGDLVDAPNGFGDGFDGIHRFTGHRLHAGDLRRDILGCLPGLVGEIP